MIVDSDMTLIIPGNTSSAIPCSLINRVLSPGGLTMPLQCRPDGSRS
ncbi:MAG: hypothetical protein H6R43_30 [Nitrospirae bacterium]|nr:hypothetical protein [Nitrospirota bacterium]